MPTAPEKICVICGENCADRPRVKDSKGRYYCKSCYERLAEQKRQAAPAPPAPSDMPLEADAADAGAGVDERSALLSEIGDAAPSTGKNCPQCGAELDQQAVLCVGCGYNFQSGEALAMDVQKAKPSRSGGVWPIVIGVISLVFAIGGMGWYGLNLVSVMALETPSDADPNYSAGYGIGSFVGAIIPLLLSLWLFLAAIGVLRNSQRGVSLMRLWAMTKILLTSILGGCLITVLLIGTSTIPQEQFPINNVGTGLLVFILIAFLAWILAWPIFVLIWFRRDVIEQQVAEWD